MTYFPPYLLSIDICHISQKTGEVHHKCLIDQLSCLDRPSLLCRSPVVCILGNILWVQDYHSPVVAIYQLDVEFSGLRKVMFASVGSETLQYVSGQLTSDEWRLRFLQLTNDIQTFQLVFTLMHLFD